MEGNLIVSSKSAQHILFKSLKPLLDAAGGKNSILCGSLPRYLFKGCCNNPEHMSNRNLDGFETCLQRDLKETCENFKDFMFTSGYKSIKVLDPYVSWKGAAANNIWGEDPVHPIEAAYNLIAEGALVILRNMESGARKRARTNSIETEGPGGSTALNRRLGVRGGPTQASFTPTVRGRGGAAARSGGGRGGN
jgi:hypothetical protein